MESTPIITKETKRRLVVDYEGKYKQIITACGEAATACNSAYKFVKKPYWA